MPKYLLSTRRLVGHLSALLTALLAALLICGGASLAGAGVQWTAEADALGIHCDPTYLPVGATLLLDITVRSDDQALLVQGSVNGYDDTILRFDPTHSILPDSIFNAACDAQGVCVGGLVNEIGTALPVEETNAGPGTEVDILSASSTLPAAGFGDADLGAVTGAEGDPQFRIAFSVLSAGTTTIDIGTFPAYLDAYSGTVDDLATNTSIEFEADHFAYSDSDADGWPDACDNCLVVANGRNDATNQLDTDFDGYGNVCDTDYNQDGYTSTLDFAVFLEAFTQAVPDPDTDHDGDGATTTVDFPVFLEAFRSASGPGPSGYPCAGVTVPCPAD